MLFTLISMTGVDFKTVKVPLTMVGLDNEVPTVAERVVLPRSSVVGQ